eukprot:9223373-Pyramimonas_sp.AAC.1
MDATFWGAAVAGNPCIQEAFLSSINEVAAHWLRLQHGHAMLDTEARCDSIPWQPPVEADLHPVAPPVM